MLQRTMFCFQSLTVSVSVSVSQSVLPLSVEILGNGTVFGLRVLPESYEPISIFILAPGAFLVLSLLCALMNKLGVSKKEKKKTGCTGNCAECPSAEKEGK